MGNINDSNTWRRLCEGGVMRQDITLQREVMKACKKFKHDRIYVDTSYSNFNTELKVYIFSDQDIIATAKVDNYNRKLTKTIIASVIKKLKKDYDETTESTT